MELQPATLAKGLLHRSELTVSGAALQVARAHLWGILILGETEVWTGVLGSLIIASGVITVSKSKVDAAGTSTPDETTAFVTAIESKAVEYRDSSMYGEVDQGSDLAHTLLNRQDSSADAPAVDIELQSKKDSSSAAAASLV